MHRATAANAERLGTVVGSGEFDEVRSALARPEFYPHHPPSVEIRETHISWVFLAGDRAYKLKKPSQLDFLDYSTAARRREMCREEVRLNRRLAPDIYLGVRGIARGPDGFELTDEANPRAIEFVVEMRRFDEASTLAALLDRESVTSPTIEALGRRIAEFHHQARVVVASAPVLSAERRVEGNLHELFQSLHEPAGLDRVLALERFAHAFIVAHAAALQARAAAGLVREGHGDLRAEHVVVQPTLEIVDCVEFDQGLRELDVSDDLAFLVSDLTALGADDEARALVRAYREARGDPGEDTLIAFYACYRALVRAKVELLRADQLDSLAASERAREHGWSLIEVAERFAWRARLPLVIVVCGVPASRKSSLAAAVAQASGLPHLSSDLTRK